MVRLKAAMVVDMDEITELVVGIQTDMAGGNGKGNGSGIGNGKGGRIGSGSGSGNGSGRGIGSGTWTSGCGSLGTVCEGREVEM